MKPIRAVFYGRKSDDDDGNSIEQQQQWQRDIAPREGVEIVREFIDQSKSGWDTSKRTAFHEMLKFCQEQAKARTPIQAIACWHTNRFSRADSQETDWYVWEFRKAGTSRMLTAERWFDFGRAEDRLLFGVGQDFSNNPYVKNLARDSLRGRIAAASAGRWAGGPIPLGYRAEYEEIIRKGKKRRRPTRLILGPDAEVQTVKTIYDLYANTPMGLFLIARELTRRGIPTPRGRAGWTTVALKKILTNPVYLGRIAWNKSSVGKFVGVIDCQPVEIQGNPAKGRNNDKDQWIQREDRHEPIIDLVTFERCQQKLAGRAGGKRRPRGTFVLTGLLRCAHCGRGMVGRTEVSGRRVYYCGGYHCGDSSCHYNAVDADALADALLKKLQPAWNDEVNIDAIVAEAERQEAQEEDAEGRKAESLRRRLKQLDAEITTGVNRLRTIDLSLFDQFQDGLKLLKAEYDQKAAELRRLETEPTAAADQRRRVEGTMAVLRRLNLAADAGDPDLLRVLLAEVVTEITVWFSHEPYGTKGKKTRCRFAQAVVGVQEDVALLYANVNNVST